MNRIIPIALLCAMSAILGCESTPHYNRTKIVVTGAALPKKPYGTVKLFQSNSEVTSNYDVIALMSVEGSPGDESAFIKAFLYRAADVGADAIILHRGTVVAGQQGIGAGAKGSFGFLETPSQDAVYRAEAIHFK
jgi:hypothetical protein